jgi:hypothetical protein
MRQTDIKKGIVLHVESGTPVRTVLEEIKKTKMDCREISLI